MSETRLQKYLAEAGVASRRKSEELILQGRVKVNGATVDKLGTKVSEGDAVSVDGREITLREEKVYIILNKPVGYVTTANDQFARKTVLDLVIGVNERIYPVGRLDYETSGLLLLTNDGDVAYSMTHPGHEIEKVYQARLNTALEDIDIRKLEKGIRVEDYVTSPAKVSILERQDRGMLVEITIHEGRNRQVRKMFETLGYTVTRLRRVAAGPLKLNGLEEGKWRYLSEQEIESLKILT